MEAIRRALVIGLVLLFVSLFNNHHLLIQVARVQKAQFPYGLDGLSKQRPERSCDRVARCRLDKRVSSSLIGGGRLLSILLSVMLSIALLRIEV